MLDEAIEFVDELDEDPIVDGCNKVDYLFVIDNSASMGPYQTRVVENFSTFVEGVRESQTSTSVHVGVVTTDGYAGNPSECGDLGDLVTSTSGHNSSWAQCGPYAEGHRYMTDADPLESAFACTAQVGTTGSTSERTLSAIGTALSNRSRSPGACNEGFLRDDALLIIVIVTDEDDPSAVEFAYNRAVDAKHGYDDNVVVVALVIPPGGSCEHHGHSGPAANIISFAESFEHSFIGGICDDDYAPTFAGALDVIRNACG